MMVHRQRKITSPLWLLKGSDRLGALQAAGLCKRGVFPMLQRLEVWQLRGQRRSLSAKEGLWMEQQKKDRKGFIDVITAMRRGILEERTALGKLGWSKGAGTCV